MSNTFPRERTAIVTGAGSARGIGRAVAARLACAGWSLGLLDIDANAVTRLASELAERHDVAIAGVAVDVGDQSAVDASLDALETRLPPVIGLANVAGVSSPEPY